MNPINCLVVDDSRTSRILLTKIIRQLSPAWRLIEAENGQQALDLANEQDFHVIFLDYNMPVMTGGDAARVLRPKFPDAKIAFLTANVQDSIKNLAMELKIDFIPKPITENKIASYINYAQF